MPEWGLTLLMGLFGGGTTIGVLNLLFGSRNRRIDENTKIIKNLREENDEFKQRLDELKSELTADRTAAAEQRLYVFEVGIWTEQVASVLTDAQRASVGPAPVNPMRRLPAPPAPPVPPANGPTP